MFWEKIYNYFKRKKYITAESGQILKTEKSKMLVK